MSIWRAALGDPRRVGGDYGGDHQADDGAWCVRYTGEPTRPGLWPVVTIHWYVITVHNPFNVDQDDDPGPYRVVEDTEYDFVADPTAMTVVWDYGDRTIDHLPTYRTVVAARQAAEQYARGHRADHIDWDGRP